MCRYPHSSALRASNGGKKGNQNLRPLAGRTTYSRINFDALDPIVRPARGCRF